MKESFYSNYGKRIFDLAAGIVGLVLTSPLLAVVALAVKFSSPGPVLFKQIRVGQHGKSFRIFKFRSMQEKSDAGLKVTAAGDPRITALGAWLRRTKIDEFPQFFNVILGEMSVVGPRPEVPEFVARYNEAQRGVLCTRPGLMAPSAIIREEALLTSQQEKEAFYVSTIMPAKLQIDLEYCQGISFKSDLEVLFRILIKLSNKLHDPFMGAAHSDNPLARKEVTKVACSGSRPNDNA